MLERLSQTIGKRFCKFLVLSLHVLAAWFPPIIEKSKRQPFKVGIFLIHRRLLTDLLQYSHHFVQQEQRVVKCNGSPRFRRHWHCRLVEVLLPKHDSADIAQSGRSTLSLCNLLKNEDTLQTSEQTKNRTKLAN